MAFFIGIFDGNLHDTRYIWKGTGSSFEKDTSEFSMERSMAHWLTMMLTDVDPEVNTAVASGRKKTQISIEHIAD